MLVNNRMIRDVVTALPGTSLADGLALMHERRIRHLPVVEAGKLVGVISIGDVVRAVIEDLRFSIHQLETYIQNGG